jgi:MYND finger
MVSTTTTPLERLLQGTLTPSSVSGLPPLNQTTGQPEQHECAQKTKATTESSVSRRASQRLHGYGHQTSCHGCGVTNETIGGFMLQCGKCRKAYYCGRDCFNAHLVTHQQFCRTNTLDCCEPNKRPLVDVWYVANQVPSSSNIVDVAPDTKSHLLVADTTSVTNGTTAAPTTAVTTTLGVPDVTRRFDKKTYIDASCSESETETESVAPKCRAPRRNGPPQEGRRAVVAAVAPTTTTTTTNQTAPTTRNVNETDDEEDDDDSPPTHRLLLLPASLHHATATNRNAVPDEEADSMYDEETIDESVEEYTIPDEEDDEEDDLDDSTIEEWDEEEEENDDKEDDYDEETVESSERYADIYCIINGQRVRRRRPPRRAQDHCIKDDESDPGDWHTWRRNNRSAATKATFSPVKQSFCDSSCSESETETESLAKEREQRCLRRRSRRRGKRPTVAATPLAASATPETPPSDTEMEESKRRQGGGPLDYHCSWSPLATSDRVGKEAGSKQDVQVCHNVDTSKAVPPHAVVVDSSMVQPDDCSRRLAHPDDSRPTTIGTSSAHGDHDIEESRTMCGGGNLHGGATAVLPAPSHDGQWPPVALKWTIPTKTNVDWEKPLWTNWRYVETVRYFESRRFHCLTQCALVVIRQLVQGSKKCQARAPVGALPGVRKMHPGGIQQCATSRASDLCRFHG